MHHIKVVGFLLVDELLAFAFSLRKRAKQHRNSLPGVAYCSDLRCQQYEELQPCATKEIRIGSFSCWRTCCLYVLPTKKADIINIILCTTLLHYCGSKNDMNCSHVRIYERETDWVYLVEQPLAFAFSV